MDFKTKAASLFAAFALLSSAASAQVVINEIDADQTGGDVEEFIELYNTGGSSVDLGAGTYVLVLVNGSSVLTYDAIDLTGSIAAGGYYVIGSATWTGLADATLNGSIQNGQDGVMLFTGASAAAVTNGTAPGAITGTQIDGAVHGTNDSDIAGLIAAVNPGQPTLNEEGNTEADVDSNQRFPDGAGGAFNTGSWVQLPPTAGVVNVPVEVSAFEIN